MDKVNMKNKYNKLVESIVKNPGVDNPDLFVHPERYIDPEVLSIILNLWKAKIHTYESGGDKDITEDSLEDSDAHTPKEWMKQAIEDGFVQREYIYKNQIREKAFVIIDKKNLEAAKKILPSNIEIEVGTGGFMPEDYNSKVPSLNKLIYIQWKQKI